LTIELRAKIVLFDGSPAITHRGRDGAVCGIGDDVRVPRKRRAMARFGRTSVLQEAGAII
jgi:hypothetical protein